MHDTEMISSEFKNTAYVQYDPNTSLAEKESW